MNDELTRVERIIKNNPNRIGLRLDHVDSQPGRKLRTVKVPDTEKIQETSDNEDTESQTSGQG